MIENLKSRLIIVSAPSGAGKTSLSKRLIAEHDDIAVAVSHTTRTPRPGEIDGEDYYFVDQTTFENLIEDDGFFEHAEVFGKFYGTSKKAVQQLLDQGKHVLLEIDWQGAQNIRLLIPESISIFILPPSKQTLQARLTARGQDSEEIIALRMRDAMNQISHYKEYNHIIVNDDFEQAYIELEAIVCNRSYQAHIDRNQIDAFVASLVEHHE